MLAIQFYRLKSDWTQADLARRANTFQPTISRIEQGRLKPSDELLGRLAQALGVSPSFALLRPVVVQDEPILRAACEQVLA